MKTYLACLAGVLAACGSATTEHDASLDPDAGSAIDAGTDAALIDAFPPDLDSGPIVHDAGFEDLLAQDAIVAAICDPLAHATCTDFFSCGCLAAQEAPADPAACAATTREACESSFEGIAGLLGADGAWSIDHDNVAACAATFAESYADCRAPALWADLFACRHMMSSRVPIGATCNRTYTLCASGAGVCDSDNRCRAIPDTSGATCTDVCAGALSCIDGTCGTPRPGGETCTDDEDCAAPHRCLEGVCRRLGHAADRCAIDDDCRFDFACRDGGCVERDNVVCTQDPPLSGSGRGDCASPHEVRCAKEPPRCRAPLGEGDWCWGPMGIPHVESDCGPGLFCDNETRMPHACAPIPARGEACPFRLCRDDSTCAFDPARSDYFCVAKAAVGEPCGSNACDTGLVCTAAGICARLPERGAACIDGHCAEGLACDRRTTTCVSPAGPSEACALPIRASTCIENYGCLVAVGETVGTCVLLPNAGDSCDVLRACRDGGICIGFGPSGYLCHAAAPEGDLCSGTCLDPENVCRLELVQGLCEPTACDTFGASGLLHPWS